MESSKTNMENRETKFKELVDEFDSLLSEYKDVWFRIRKIEWGDVIDKEKKELFSKGSNLRERLRVLGEKIFASTGSDEVKLHIICNLDDVDIKIGPCMERFGVEECRGKNEITFEEWVAEFMQRADKWYNKHRDRFGGEPDVEVGAEFEGTFEELEDRFSSLLVQYRGIWNSLGVRRNLMWPYQRESLAWEGYILGKCLRVLGEKIFASTDSDKAKLNIVYKFGFAGIEPGPLVAKFMKKQKEKNEGGDE